MSETSAIEPNSDHDSLNNFKLLTVWSRSTVHTCHTMRFNPAVHLSCTSQQRNSRISRLLGPNCFFGDAFQSWTDRASFTHQSRGKLTGRHVKLISSLLRVQPERGNHHEVSLVVRYLPLNSLSCVYFSVPRRPLERSCRLFGHAHPRDCSLIATLTLKRSEHSHLRIRLGRVIRHEDLCT